MNILIETATLDDYHAVNLIVKEGQDEHSEALPYIFKKVDIVMPESYFHELLEDTETEILIAKIEGEVVGFAVMELNDSPPFDSLLPRKVAYINDFGIKNKYQRNGIGKVLFEVCLEWSQSKGATSLDLKVWEFNNKAISFYEQFGMETISRTMTIKL